MFNVEPRAVDEAKKRADYKRRQQPPALAILAGRHIQCRTQNDLVMQGPSVSLNVKVKEAEKEIPAAVRTQSYPREV